MTARMCTHSRQLSVCAVCAPIAEDAFRQANEARNGDHPLARLEAVLDRLIARAALGDPDAMGELRRRRAASRIRNDMQLQFKKPPTSPHLPAWIRWAFPLRDGLHVRVSEQPPRGWRWFREYGRDMMVAVPLWLWPAIETKWHVLRWCYRHGLLQGPEGADFAACKWTLAFTRKPYAWMPPRRRNA